MIYQFHKSPCNLSLLLGELKGFLFEEATSNGCVITLKTTEALSASDVNFIETTIMHHDANDLLGPYKAEVKYAADFGRDLVIKFAAENARDGIVQAGKVKVIADATQTIYYYLTTGALYEARSELISFTPTEEMSPFLTEARKLVLINALETFLGLPLTE